MSFQKYPTLIIVFSLIVLITACTKGPGDGGRASITGQVFARNYSNSFVINDSGNIGNYKVFIKYGDEVGVGDNVDTDNTGAFLFPYLRKGKYTVYVFSKKLANNALDSVVAQIVNIDSRKEILSLPRFEVNTIKN